MYQSRDILSQGTINLGDKGSQNIHTGTHRFGTSRHPTYEISGTFFFGVLNDDKMLALFKLISYQQR